MKSPDDGEGRIHDPSVLAKPEGLGARTARGGAITVASQALQLLLTTLGTMVLARLLTPTDYGLVAMVTVILGFVSIFRDMGLSEATVQRAAISSEQVSTLFWINTILGLAIALVVAALAPAVAWFYDAPVLTSITITYAAAFVLGSLGVQHSALLRREMRFGALAASEIVALLTGLSCSVILAYSGARYWALVVGRLAEVFSLSLCVWIASGWRPGFPRKGSGVRPMLAFGRNLTGFSIVNYLARNVDALLLGKVWGAESLALYSKAYSLLLMPLRQINTPISTVAGPVLSRLVLEPARYRQAYVRILEKIAIVTIPGVAFLIATSDWVVAILLGPQWAQVSVLFAVLGVGALFQPISHTTGWLFVSQDRTHELFRWGMMGSTLQVLGILTGLPWGAKGVAISYTAVSVLVATPLLFWYVGRRGPVSARDILMSSTTGMLAGLAVFAAIAALRTSFPDLAPLTGLLVSLCCGGSVGMGVLLASRRGRAALADLMQTAGTILFDQRRDRTM